jgi:putative transposase
LRTLQLAFSRETSRAQRAYWKHGEKALRDHRTYGERAITHRNQIWQVDHTQLDIVVLPPRGKPLRPWLTTFVDLTS